MASMDFDAPEGVHGAPRALCACDGHPGRFMGSPVGGADPIPTDAHCRPRRQHERMMDPMEDEEASEPQGRLPTPHAPVPIRATAPALRQQGVQRVHPNRPAPPTHHHDGVRGTADAVQRRKPEAVTGWPPEVDVPTCQGCNCHSAHQSTLTPRPLTNAITHGPTAWAVAGGAVVCASGCACATPGDGTTPVEATPCVSRQGIG